MVGAGVAVIAFALMFAGLFIYLTLNERLNVQLYTALDERAETARDLAVDRSPPGLAAALESHGITAKIVGPDGVTHRSAPIASQLRFDPSGIVDRKGTDIESTVIELDDGMTAEIFISRDLNEQILTGLLALFATACVFALAFAGVLLHKVAEFSLAPLKDVVRTADRTASGVLGERLRPDNTESLLGQLAVSYDRMLDQLEAALVRAQAAEIATRQFVDDAAHQLRTPLAAVRSSSEAIVTEQDPEIRDRLLSNMTREVRRANVILTSLLTLARLDEGTKRAVEPTDLVAVCEHEVARMQDLQPGLTITCDLDDELNGLWLMDHFGIREIMANLLDNARKHALTRITVTGGLRHQLDGQSCLEVRVDDDGPGIPDGGNELIFQRFATLDGLDGSGLGLPVARGIARAQAGDVVYEEGTFIVRLPANRAAAEVAG